MKIIENVKFEPEDFKLLSAVIAGNIVSLSGVPEELQKIVFSVKEISSQIKNCEIARETALTELKKIPVEIRRRYFEKFIKENTYPQVRWDFKR